MQSHQAPPAIRLGGAYILGGTHQRTEACGILYDPNRPSYDWTNPHDAVADIIRRQAAERDADARALKTAELLRYRSMRAAFMVGLRADLAALIREIFTADLPEALSVLGVLPRRKTR